MYFNLPIEAPKPGHEQDPGVHYVDLHFRGRTGLLHQSVESGDPNPLDIPIGQFAMLMLAKADQQSGDRDPPLPAVSRLVGMTVYRAGIHEYETSEGNADHKLVATKLASFAFVKKTGVYLPVEYIPDRQISTYGVARMRVDGRHSYYVQHLRPTDVERKLPVKFATPSVSARGNHRDSWVGLRPKTDSKTKQRNSFVERIVTGEELNDTLK